MTARKAKAKPKKALMKFQLVDNYNEMWKAASMWFYAGLIVVGLLGAFWGGMQNHLDEKTYSLGVAVLAALGGAFRMIKQPTVSE
jgi:uncharacterized membrane protein YiaA